jgi:hypothetical protein
MTEFEPATRRQRRKLAVLTGKYITDKDLSRQEASIQIAEAMKNQEALKSQPEAKPQTQAQVTEPRTEPTEPVQSNDEQVVFQLLSYCIKPATVQDIQDQAAVVLQRSLDGKTVHGVLNQIANNPASKHHESLKTLVSNDLLKPQEHGRRPNWYYKLKFGVARTALQKIIKLPGMVSTVDEAQSIKVEYDKTVIGVVQATSLKERQRLGARLVELTNAAIETTESEAEKKIKKYREIAESANRVIDDQRKITDELLLLAGYKEPENT